MTVAANAEPGVLLRIPLEQLHPSSTNPRKVLGNLDDLIASIKVQGVVEPLIARPEGPPGFEPPAYEVVAGHRRLAAATIAGLTTLPVIVRELDDAQVLELQLVENVQREDLTPLEEGEGYKRLRDEVGLTPEEIAERIGKHKQHVYSRLKLTELGEAGRKLLEEGKLPPSAALPIARLEPELQEKALKMLRADYAYRKDEPITARDAEWAAKDVREEAKRPAPDPEAAEKAKRERERWAEQEKARRAEESKREAVRQRKVAELEAGLALAIPPVVEKAERADLPTVAYRQIVKALVTYDNARAVLARRGVKVKKAAYESIAQLQRYAATLSVANLRGLIAELLLRHNQPIPYRPTFDKDVLEVARAFKVDLDRCVKQAKKAAAKVAPAKKATRKKPGRKK